MVVQYDENLKNFHIGVLIQSRHCSHFFFLQKFPKNNKCIVCLFLDHNCTIFSWLKFIVIFNTSSADFQLMSSNVILKWPYNWMYWRSKNKQISGPLFILDYRVHSWHHIIATSLNLLHKWSLLQVCYRQYKNVAKHAHLVYYFVFHKDQSLKVSYFFFKIDKVIQLL